MSSSLAQFSKLYKNPIKARNNHLGGQGNEVSGTVHPVLAKRIPGLLAGTEQFQCMSRSVAPLPQTICNPTVLSTSCCWSQRTREHLGITGTGRVFG